MNKKDNEVTRNEWEIYLSRIKELCTDDKKTMSEGDADYYLLDNNVHVTVLGDWMWISTSDRMLEDKEGGAIHPGPNMFIWRMPDLMRNRGKAEDIRVRYTYGIENPDGSMEKVVLIDSSYDSVRVARGLDIKKDEGNTRIRQTSWSCPEEFNYLWGEYTIARILSSLKHSPCFLSEPREEAQKLYKRMCGEFEIIYDLVKEKGRISPQEAADIEFYTNKTTEKEQNQGEER